MIKHLILPVFILAATLATAVAQITSYTGNGWSYNNGVFSFTSQYVWTDFAARIDPKSSGSLSKTSLNLNDIVEFGYYKIEGGQAGEGMTMFKRDETGALTVKNSAIFNAGDSIGIYAKIQEETAGHYEGHGKHKTYVPGETVTNTYTTTANAIEGATKVTNNVDHDSIGAETQYFCLFLDGFKFVDHFEYYLQQVITGDNYNDFINDVIAANTDENGNPITNLTDGNGNPVSPVSGQPLPGLLLTLCFGGAAATVLSGASKRRKARGSIWA